MPWKPKGKYKPSGAQSGGGYGERSERPVRSGSKPWSEGSRDNNQRKPKSGAPKHQWKNPRANASSDGGRDDGAAQKSGQGKWKPGGFKSGGSKPGGFKSGGPKPGGFKSGGKSGGPKRGGVKSSGPRPGGFKSGGPKPGGFKSGGPKRGGTTNRYSTASRNRTSGRGVRG